MRTRTDFEESFQFPIKRVGASPVAASDADVVAVAEEEASADADALGVADADSVAAGAAVEEDASSEFDFDMTIAASATTPIKTARSTRLDAPWRGAAAALAGAGFAAEVVETFTAGRELCPGAVFVAVPVDGTGGITTDEAEAFLAVDFLTVFFAAVRAVVRLAGDFFATFFATAFLATAFLATFLVAFLTAAFFATDFFAVFLAVVFFADVFFATDFFATVFLAVVFLVADFFTATCISLDCGIPDGLPCRKFIPGYLIDLSHEVRWHGVIFRDG